MAEREKNGQEGIFCACGNRGDVPGERVNLRRIREKLDALEAAGDTEGAARLLNYWIAEAQFIGDRTGEALLENEFVGMYRKAGRGAEALRHGDRALSLLEAGGLEDTVTAGTTRINVATACTAFGQEERACLLFEQARKIYEARLDATDERLGGLYNNMGLCMISLGRFAEGRQLFDRALAVMSTVPCGEGEAAVTCLNLADLSSAEAEAAGDEESLGVNLRGALDFLNAHLLIWVPQLLERMAASESDWLYPQLVLILNSFLKQDRETLNDILSEGAHAHD